MDYIEMTFAGNELLSGRGNAGTHDIELGVTKLKALKAKESRAVEIPQYDREAHKGKGDRTEEKYEVLNGVDLVLFEGWMLGY